MIVLSSISLGALAQQPIAIDSLKINDATSKARKLLQEDTQKAVLVAEKALSDATSNGYVNGRIECLTILGLAHKCLKSYTLSLDYFLQASKELERLGSTHKLTDIWIEIGSLFQSWDAPGKAVEYYQLAYQKLDQNKDPVLTAKVINALGSNYQELSNRSEAIKYFELLLELNRGLQDTTAIFSTLKQLTAIYTANSDFQKAIDYQLQMLELKREVGQMEEEVAIINNIGYLYKNLNQNTLALRSFERSLQLSRQLNSTKPSQNEDVILMNIALIYQAKGEYGQALQSLFSALKIRDDRGDELGASKVHFEIAYTYQVLGRFKVALEHAEKAVEVTEKYEANESLVESYKILSDIHLARGDNQNALKYYKKHAQLMGQLYTTQILQRRQRQENLENQLEIEKKEKELKLLMIDKEMKDLTLKELQATTAKKETDITLLKREKQLQEVSLKIKESENEKAQQALQLSQQRFEAEKKDKEIELLQKNKSIQLLALNKNELEEKEKQKTIELLNERKALQEAELSRSKALRSFFVGLSLLFAIILFLIYRGYREKQKANKSLAEQNTEIQKQRDRLQKAIAELKAAQSQIVQSEKMASLGELTAGIAHEINNPINFVYAGVDGLRTSLEGLLKVLDKYTEIDRTGNIAEIRKVLSEVEDIKKQLYYDETKDSVFNVVKAIKEGASRTAEIVKGLRSFTRLDETELKRANIHDGIENTLILLNPKIDQAGITIVKKYDPSIPEIECFPSQLNQVFMNILSNATEAIEGSGTISIETKDRPRSVQVSIKDNGSGMPNEIKSKIFQPFFTTKNPGEGTGLGLSITFGIIDKHQGTIDVVSHPGEGACFIITLPKHITSVPAVN